MHPFHHIEVSHSVCVSISWFDTFGELGWIIFYKHYPESFRPEGSIKLCKHVLRVPHTMPLAHARPTRQWNPRYRCPVLWLHVGHTASPTTPSTWPISCHPALCQDMRLFPTPRSSSQTRVDYQIVNLQLLSRTREDDRQYWYQPSEISILHSNAHGPAMETLEDVEVGWMCTCPYWSIWNSSWRTCPSLSILPLARCKSTRRLGFRSAIHAVSIPSLIWAMSLTKFRFLYMMFMCMDANFHLKNQMVSNWSQDPGLGIGWSYMVPRQPYEQYVLSRASDGNVSLPSSVCGLY